MQNPGPAASEAPSRRFWIGVGSNLGDRVGTLRSARTRLAARLGTRVDASSFYETPPMYESDQPAFANGVFRFESHEPAGDVLRVLLEVEREHGRDRESATRFGPRPLDLDIVAVEGLVMRTPTLTVPHPRMQERAFVLVPLQELDAGWRHPESLRSVDELLAELSEDVAKIQRLCGADEAVEGMK